MNTFNPDTYCGAYCGACSISESEKKQPAIGRILISNAIEAKDHKTALLRIDAMPDSFLDDPQVLFRQGWVQYSLHKDMQALETFSNLNKKFPQNKWANTAIIFIEGIRNFERYNQSIARSLYAALDVLRGGISILQAKSILIHEIGENITWGSKIFKAV